MVQKQKVKKETLMAPKKEKKTNQNPKMKRTSKGRRKIEIRRIENETNRQVTLSKRRKGLFNKGAELCILTGAEIAIITQTESGKVSTFGHPDIDNVIDRYLNVSGQNSPSPPAPPVITEQPELVDEDMYRRLTSELEAQVENSIDNVNGQNSPSAPTPINAELVDEDRRLTSELEAEKKKYKANMANIYWWDEPTDNLGAEELEERLEALIKLRNNVIAAAANGVREMTSSLCNDDDDVQTQCSSEVDGVSDNVVEIEQQTTTANADELDVSDYFYLDESMLADELMKESQSLNNIDFDQQQTLGSTFNDFCSSEDFQSFCNVMDPYGSNFAFC